MILQTDTRMHPQINEYGCYLLSILWFGVMHTKLQLSAEMISGQIYPRFVKRGFMTDTCFIERPVAIFDFLNMGVEMIYVDGSHRVPADRKTMPDEIEILRYKVPGSISHFIAGNGLSQPAYDPYGLSRSVREGRLMDKRVFRFTDGRLAA